MINSITIISTIHQPRFEVFRKFTKLLLLSEGKIAYFGPTEDVVNYFTSLGYRCPRFQNPADYCLDLIRINRNENDPDYNEPQVEGLLKAYMDSAMRRQQLPFLFKKEPLFVDSHDEESLDENEPMIGSLFGRLAGRRRKNKQRTSKEEGDDDENNNNNNNKGQQRAPFWIQLYVLALRTFRHSKRDPLIFWATLIQFIIFAVLGGFTWFQLPEGGGLDYNSIRDRNGAIWFLQIVAGMVPVLSVSAMIPPMRALLQREHEKRAYRPSMFFLSFTVIFTPQHIVFALIYVAITFFMVGFPTNAQTFFLFVVVIVLIIDAMYHLGFFISSFAPSADVANMFVSLTIMIWVTFSGYFIQPDAIPDYFIWAYYSSMFKYGTDALVRLNFDGQTNTCPLIPCDFTSTEMVTIGNSTVPASDLLATCSATSCLANSDEIYSFLGISTTLQYWENIIILLAYPFAFRLLTYLCLRFVSPRLGKQK